MIIDFLKTDGGLITVISALIGIIAILVKFGFKVYGNYRSDKNQKATDQAVIAAETEARRAEDSRKQTVELYEKFIQEYKELSNKNLENTQHMIQAIEDNKKAIQSMETIVKESSNINERLTDSVDKMRDTLTQTLINITK